MALSDQSVLALHRLEVRKDRKHYIVEDAVTGEFFEMPLVAVEAIRLIEAGGRLGDIEAELKQRFPAEEIDLVSFAGQLVEMDLIEAIDGVAVEPAGLKKERAGFGWIRPGIGRFFFNPWSAKVYVLLFLANLLIFLWKPQFFPHYRDLFVFDVMMLNIITWMCLSIVLILIHEWGHVFAIRAHGLPTKISVGNRLFLVVLETDMAKAWKLPAGQRNLLYLAGMCFDNVILFLALMGKLFFPEHSQLLPGLLGLIVFDIVLRLIYQCCVYMKTDLYYVIENTTGCYNLLENGKHFLHKWLPFIKEEKHTEIFAGEKKVVQWYAGFYLIGVALTLTLFTAYYIPQMIYMFVTISPGFQKPLRDPQFWDAWLLTLQMAIFAGLLAYSFIKKRRIAD